QLIIRRDGWRGYNNRMFVEGQSPSTHIRSRFPLHPSSPRCSLWMEYPSRDSDEFTLLFTQRASIETGRRRRGRRVRRPAQSQRAVGAIQIAARSETAALSRQSESGDLDLLLRRRQPC